MYVLNLFDYQAGGVSLIFIALMEVLTIGWFYGAGRLRNQVSHMIGYVPSFWWNICWCFTTPLILASIFIFALVEWKGVSYGKQKYPVWAEVIGWFMACSSMAMVPLWAIITLIRTKGDSFAEVSICFIQWSSDYIFKDFFQSFSKAVSHQSTYCINRLN